MKARWRVEPPGGVPFERDCTTAEVIIGRSQTAALVLSDVSASRQHARAIFRDDRWWIEDLGATNRTVLNNQKLDGAACLRPGDELRIGGTVLYFLGDPDEPPDSPEDGDSLAIEPVFLKTIGGAEADTAAGTAPSGDSAPGRQAARLQLLNEIHRALATPISLSSLLELILARCFEVLRPEEGVVLLRGAGGELHRAASRRLPNAQGELFVSRRIVEEVVDKGQAVLVIDATTDERLLGSDSVIFSGVRSAVAAPLTDADGTIGMIALYSRASVRQFSQNDLDVLASLASAAVLRVRNVALAEEAAERRVLEHELSLAHDMQMSMLPRRLPERREVALAAALKPARSVGGDLYDFVIDEDRLWFIVADVSGKGMAAALYMAVAQTLFRATVQGRVELGHVLHRMNTELCRDNDRMIFVTALVGHLTLATGAVALADAGHNAAVVIDAGGAVHTPPVPKGVALGVVEDFPFTERAWSLEPGATLVLYTDGATDARDPSGELFGADRLNRVLSAHAGELPDALVVSVVGDIETFEAGAPPEDDLTILALRYRGHSDILQT